MILDVNSFLNEYIEESLENKTYTSMVICFVAFLASDLYAFINWGKLEKNQGLTD